MKIGFLFLAVKDIKNAEVWQHWFANATCDYEIFIHSKNKYNNYPDYSVFKDKLVKRYVETKWGKLIAAQMLMWQEAYNAGCDYFIMTGDKNLPINHFEFLHQELINAQGKSIFIFGKPWWDVRKEPEFEMKGAYQWIITNREHTKMLFESHKIFKDVRFSTNHADDEIYPATTINFYKQLTDEFVIRKNLTYVDWSRGSNNNSHPYTFNRIDDYNYNLLLNKAKNYIFARKFNELIKIDKLKIFKIQNERLFNTDDSRKDQLLEKLVAKG